MQRCFFVLIWILCQAPFAGAQVFTETIEPEWEEVPRTLTRGEDVKLYYLHFKGAAYDEAKPQLPLWTKNYNLNQYSRLSVEVLQAEYAPLPPSIVFEPGLLSEGLDFETPVGYDRRRPVGLVRFCPIRLNPSTGQPERLVRTQLRVVAAPAAPPYPIGSLRNNTTTSVLADGSVYKIAVEESGVYRLSYTFLKDLGVDVDNIDPRRISIYGNGGKPLEELIVPGNRIDDLTELAVWVQGESDGKFDSGDFVAFYAQGVDYWSYSTANGYVPGRNPYSARSHYFIKINSTNGKRIQPQASVAATDYTSTAYDALTHYEKDLVNLMEGNFSLPASGRRWFGEAFQITRSRDFSFSFSNRIATEPLRLRAVFATRVLGSNATWTISANGSTLLTGNANKVSGGVYDAFATEQILNGTAALSGNNVNININFSHPSSTGEGWLDYLLLHARCQLSFTGGQMRFRDHKSLDYAATLFELGNASGVTLWDVTDPYNPGLCQGTLNGSTLRFGATSDVLRELVAFDQSGFKSPTAIGRINNQNLHGITTAPHLLIVHHPDFAQGAQLLAQHRRTFNNYTVVTADINQIYNEFSSGNADPTAIRDFALMLYNRASGTDDLRYLLLFGDGSFDYKSLNTNRPAGNSNFVPVYETANSLDPLSTFTCDDYFGLLDQGEGDVYADQWVDIGIGRLPVSSAAQASQVAQKLIAYETQPDRLGDWRNRILSIADDEDSNTHVNDAEGIVQTMQNLVPIYNYDKIYIDAYPQQSTSGGNRYPDVNEALMNALFKGQLITSYLGHGGPSGWAQERIFTMTEIDQLNNADKLPLFITATCSFAPFDDPNSVSAGEHLVLNRNGGAVGLFTTTRVVYADANEKLTRNSVTTLLTPLDGNGTMPHIGDALRIGKNAAGILSRANSRKFSLLGDPALTLSYPRHRVHTTHINGQPVAVFDTLQALQHITIAGEVRDLQGNLLSDFNGTVYPTVFDKEDTVRTRSNDPGSPPKLFTLQKKIVFKGTASVVNGKFSFSFVVPKDINYRMGLGRISYYAENQQTDAHGIHTDVMIGGTYAGAAADNSPPLVQVFMNDDKFASGGITDENPLLFAKLYDENGINTVGNSIGHDLMGKVSLSVGDEKEYVLNEYYRSEKDDYTRGTLSYPLKNLPEGRHTARVKAWDTHNNVGEGYTEFVVASNAKLALQHVLNYPNPFTTNTKFQFEHNFPGQSLNVQVRIFTVSGQIVKTIQQTVVSPGFRVDDIEWDGLDDYGDRIGRGVYVYKISVQANDLRGQTQLESEYQKLVILR